MNSQSKMWVIFQTTLFSFLSPYDSGVAFANQIPHLVIALQRSRTQSSGSSYYPSSPLHSQANSGNYTSDSSSSQSWQSQLTRKSSAHLYSTSHLMVGNPDVARVWRWYVKMISQRFQTHSVMACLQGAHHFCLLLVFYLYPPCLSGLIRRGPCCLWCCFTW